MTPEQFQDALDLHGPKLAKWPADDAQSARHLLAISAEARDALAQAERLEAELAGLLSTRRPAPAALRAAIFDALPAQASAEIVRFPDASPARAATPAVTGAWRRLPAAAAAVLVACFVGGICASTVFSGEDEAESVYVSAVYGDLAF